MDSQEILYRLRKDLLKFKLSYEYFLLGSYEKDFIQKQVGEVEKGFILPTLKDYEKVFNKNQKTISRIINNNFSEEEKEYRKRAVIESLKLRTRIKGVNLWRDLPDKERKKRAEDFSKLSKTWHKRSKNSEKIVKLAFESLGWKVRRLFKLESEVSIRNRFLRKIVLTKKKIFREKVHYSNKLDTEGLLSFLERIPEKEKVVSCLQELNLLRNALPDFILRKDNSFMFVEVKSQTRERKYRQAVAIKKLREEGYEVVIYNFIVKEKLSKKEVKKEVKNFIEFIQQSP